ncbi:MAG TPA: hypothetical protein VE684_20410 [Crenalkalicoccus sp.]|nr:hypothetical protein [Crenalkalicoccus sp.]
MRRLLAALLLLSLPAAAQPLPFSFVAFGDMPYCDPRDPVGCRTEVARVDALVETINTASPAFTLFLGDTKSGNETCSDPIVVDRTLAWMGRFAGPLIYSVGDNEWTDCWQQRSGAYDPLDRLRLIRERFFAAPRSLGQVPIPLARQADLDPLYRRYVENARWQRNGVLFVSVHVPGSDNNRPIPPRGDAPPGAAEEYPARNRANIAWIEDAFALAAREGLRAVVFGIQADMYYKDRCGRGAVEGFLDTRKALEDGARKFDRPVLLLHGDSHFFLDDHPVPDLPNLRRIMVPGERDTRAVLIRVTPEAAEPFAPALIGAGDRPAQPGCG